MTLPRPLTAIAVTAMLLTALTACSVNVVDGAQPRPAASDDATQTDADAETGPPLDVIDEQAEPDAGDDIDREALIAAATNVRRCDGELTIVDNAVLVRVEGPCDRLIVNSSGSQVVTDDVTFLEVVGDGNVVLSGTVETLLVNGAANVVHWQGATPTVTETGAANVLTAG